MKKTALLLFALILCLNVFSQDKEKEVAKLLYEYCADTNYRDPKILKELVLENGNLSERTQTLLEYTQILLKSRENSDQYGKSVKISDFSPIFIKLLKIIEKWEVEEEWQNLNFAYGNTARSLYNLGVYDYAIIYFKRKIALNRPDSNFANDVYMLANSYLLLDKDVQNTISTIKSNQKKLDELTPKNMIDSVTFEFNQLLISANYKIKQYVEALRLLELNINQYSKNLSLHKKVEAYSDLAHLKLMRKQRYAYLFEMLMKKFGKTQEEKVLIQEAEILFNFKHEIYAETPDSVRDYINNNSYNDRGTNYLLILKHTGDLEFENKKFRKAYREYKEILKEYANHLDGENKLGLYSNLGYSAQEIGKNKEAASYFKAYIDYKAELDTIIAKRKKTIQDVIYYFRNAKNMAERTTKETSLATIGEQKDILRKQKDSLTQAKKDVELSEAKAKNRRYFNIGLILIISVVVGFLIFFVRSDKKNNELLLNILPRKIAKELKSKTRFKALKKDKNPTIIDEYKTATVLFTDFVGFTMIAEHLSPEELVEELNQCFAKFDEISKRNRLEKIKTIGDAYMAAGGIPDENQTNPEDAVNAAIEMIEFIEDFNEKRRAENMPEWKVRVGINTGHIVAGIIGKHKYSYDVWGDAVNLASRMESSGEPGKINISENTYELVKDKFECSFRGEVNAKNKGKVKMYFVEKRK